MSKNYILEPVELTFSTGARTDSTILSEEDILAIPQDALAQIGDTIFKFSFIENERDATFTENGIADADDESLNTYFRVSYFELGGFNTFAYLSNGQPVSGTFTVSIYTEDDDSDVKPYIDEKLSKNVTYTDHPHNNWEAFLEKMTGDKTGYNTIEKISNASGNNSEGESSEDTK
jgi:hypothetical protein